MSKNTQTKKETAIASPVKIRRLEYDPHEHYGKGRFCQLCRRTRESEIHVAYEEAQS